MTITTALFDLGRKDWPDYPRSIEQYKGYALNMTTFDCNMVIYTTKDLQSFFEEARKRIDPTLSKTKIVIMDLEEIPYYDYMGKLTQLMRSDFFINNIRNKHPDRNRPEANFPIYNIIQFAKSKFVKKTIMDNYFDSEQHCWLDAGVYHHYFPQRFLNKKFPYKNGHILDDNKIHQFYRMHPKDSDINKLTYYADLDDVRIVGAWFGGKKSAMIQYSDIINKVVDDSINENVISDDQNIYTISYLENKDKFNLHDGNFSPYGPWFSGVDFFL